MLIQKSINDNVDVKTFTTKNPKDKHKEVELGLVTVVDQKQTIEKEENESVKKRKGSDPHGSTKRVKLEIDTGEKTPETN